MKKFYHLILLNFFLVCTVVSSNAKIRLPEIISSNMVLQRNTNVKIWGWATPNEKISAKLSWISNVIKVVANANGKWEFSVATTLSKTPQTIHLNSPESDIDLTNILFGEVWVCSGQSNMRMPLKGYTGQPTFDGNRAIAKASNPNLRLFSIKEMGSPTELDSVIGYKKWEQSSSENAKDFSAVAFFYGKQLQEILDVPVGLIMTSWGGTRIQPWISNETIGPLLENFKTKKDTTEHYKRIPSAIYNAMIHPIINYSIKGVLWYQGETNRDEPKVYEQLFPLMVQDWRKKWNIGDFPFYYVQIAPNNYTDKSNSQLLREVQLNASQKIPNSGIAITADIGSDKTIHPPRKNEVAERLLFIALNQSYGMKNVDCVGPIYKAMEEKESGLFLSFDNAESGLFCSKEELSGFEIAGEDKVFYPAKAEIIKGKQIKVSNDIVKNPKAVRYGWSNWFEGSLYDNNMLPASSFRTDNWE